MRKLVKSTTLCGLTSLCVVFCSVSVAGAQVREPQDWDGHGRTNCEPATHVAYYDPRNMGSQGAGNPDQPYGDNTYYVDTNPLADFRPDGNYDDPPAEHECDGTPVLRSTAYVGVTLQGELWLQDVNKGSPGCSNRTDPQNPGCDEPRTGVYTGVYVSTPDGSTDYGTETGVANPFSEGDDGNLP